MGRDNVASRSLCSIAALWLMPWRRNEGPWIGRNPHIPMPHCGYRCAAEQRNELAPFHVWMAPAWQEKM
jgi:hypothetical protein